MYCIDTDLAALPFKDGSFSVTFRLLFSLLQVFIWLSIRSSTEEPSNQLAARNIPKSPINIEVFYEAPTILSSKRLSGSSSCFSYNSSRRSILIKRRVEKPLRLGSSMQLVTVSCTVLFFFDAFMLQTIVPARCEVVARKQPRWFLALSNFSVHTDLFFLVSNICYRGILIRTNSMPLSIFKRRRTLFIVFVVPSKASRELHWKF